MNNTESFNFEISNVVDIDGKNKTLLEPIVVRFSKSETFVVYPLEYLQTVAFKPVEKVIYKTDYLIGTGCKDLPTDSTCGYAVNSVTGEAIRDSQGFCCSCSMSDYFGADQNSRGNLGCSLFGSKSSSAHCLSFSELKYDVFDISETRVQYQINATVQSFYNQLPIVDVVKLSNDVTTGKTSQVIIRIVGDLSTSTQIKQYPNKKIVFPRASSDPISSLPIINTSLLLDDDFFDLSGAGCNKIGVGYSAFQNQANRCAAVFQSCLQNQISDYYANDLKLINDGKKGRYIISQLGTSVKVISSAANKNSRSFAVRFDEIQRTILTLTLSADSLQFVVNISPAKIISYNIETFESMSNNGVLKISVQNTGALNADYLLQVHNCSGDIIQMPNQIATIQPKEIYVFSFQIYTTTMLQSYYYCFADLVNEQSTLLQSIRINFNTSKTIIEQGAQSGDNPNNQSDSLNIGYELTCDLVCPNFFNIICYLGQLKICSTRLSLLLLSLIAILVTGFLFFKFPIFRNLIKTCFCCCKKTKKSSKRKKKKDHNSSEDEDENENGIKLKEKKITKKFKYIEGNNNNNINNNINNNSKYNNNDDIRIKNEINSIINDRVSVYFNENNKSFRVRENNNRENNRENNIEKVISNSLVIEFINNNN
ncbi:hypothetical protein DICPUDRAFT_156210 [Dictyostelium purpureum]|uniref:Generative cell specific-1/HAP2 domain-containing protein n=1 Tax=Dictyostelium purpureum TaxID=5786 RepID=F0ZW03_DICPU|nr:uncharacterized protein DICPUDRAFT_156210 [Dictyostelium purpureum]EGC31861.1 hypothetical protein DICPUDRAFT_156210 [Dictyostelium purpureum]|eukprot:XP_003291595.1 hypothetical protein DICPUDRAFT_156210 [Dictyostelium purpureum]